MEILLGIVAGAAAFGGLGYAHRRHRHRLDEWPFRERRRRTDAAMTDEQAFGYRTALGEEPDAVKLRGRR